MGKQHFKLNRTSLKTKMGLLLLMMLQNACSNFPQTSPNNTNTNDLQSSDIKENSDDTNSESEHAQNTQTTEHDTVSQPSEEELHPITETTSNELTQNETETSLETSPETSLDPQVEPISETPISFEEVLETPVELASENSNELQETITVNPHSPHYTALIGQSPVDEGKLNIASPFGPRLQSGQGDRYDFHRGIDIIGERGDPIYSVADGEIVKVYDEGSSAYPDSGRVVIVKHQVIENFLFQESEITDYYSLYMHLDSFSEKVQQVLDSGVPQEVFAGDLLGGMGDSGITELLHLHFEIRLQTTCSLQYQLANPTKSCADYGFDPHINPLDLFIEEALHSAYSLELSKEFTQLNITATAERPSFNIDSVVIEIYSDESQTELLFEQSLSYNGRLGFDASTTANLDNPQLESVLILAHKLGVSAAQYQIDFAVDLASLPTAHFAKISLFNTQELVQEKTITF